MNRKKIFKGNVLVSCKDVRRHKQHHKQKGRERKQEDVMKGAIVGNGAVKTTLAAMTTKKRPIHGAEKSHQLLEGQV